MLKIGSKLVHGILSKAQAENTLQFPVFNSVAYDFCSAEDIADAFQGKKETFSYSRVSNPTVVELEDRITDISGALKTICLSSGMAAITSLIHAICESGDNIISSKYLFGNTYSLFKETFSSYNIDIRFPDLNDEQEIRNSIDDKTRFIFVETIANPQLIIENVELLSKVAKEKNILFAVDNTALTPYLFRADKWGVDIEILSLTKYFSGGGTSIGGALLIYESDKWLNYENLKDYHDLGNLALFAKIKKKIRRNTGSCLSPQSAYFHILSMETLALRIEKSCDNAIQVAKWLNNNAKIKKTYYPSLETDVYNKRIHKYANGKSGALIGFELESKKECYRFMNNLKMIRRATNFCDNKSLIIHPASTIYCDFSEEERMDFKISDKFIRLSIGIEDVEDIINDINQAL